MRRVFVAMLAMCALLTPSMAFAWNDTGHMITALIAYRRLDPATREKVDDLLQHHPHYQLYLTKYTPKGVTPAEWAFIRAATWPDFVRPARAGSPGETYKSPEITQYHRGPWHYVDLPFVPFADRQKIDPTTLPSQQKPAVPATQPTNVVEALESNSKLLAMASAKVEDRAVALAWMEHLVGDVHQPLHGVTMYSSQYPVGDKGGNEEAINTGGGYVMRLHAYWDDALGTSDAYDAIAFVAEEITGDSQLAPEKLADLKKDTTYQSWATESHDAAVALVYLNGRLRSTPWAQWEAKEIRADEVMSLPPSYAGNARALAKKRVAEAGYRLADQLKQLLSK